MTYCPAEQVHLPFRPCKLVQIEKDLKRGECFPKDAASENIHWAVQGLRIYRCYSAICWCELGTAL